jgi:hypothetical protein
MIDNMEFLQNRELTISIIDKETSQVVDLIFPPAKLFELPELIRIALLLLQDGIEDSLGIEPNWMREGKKLGVL